MTTQIQKLVGRSARYHLVNPDAIDVGVELVDDEGHGTKLHTELLDISVSGIRLRSETPVAEGDPLTITFTFKHVRELPNPMTVRANLCWATLASNGQFHLGCSIEPAIPHILLDHLAACKILERRHEVRQETAISLPTRWELDPTELAAEILNISSSGICLLIPRKGHVGDRLRLTAPDENQQPKFVYVKARWQIGTEEGFVVGCEFGDHISYVRLSQATNAQEAQAASYNPLVSA